MRELFRKINTIIEAGKKAVLVTVVASSGSTPRGSGARMLITEEGRIAGTIGGGAVEYKAEQMAADVLKNRNSFLQHFSLKKNEVQDLGMICGGDVTVFFSYLDSDNKYLTELCSSAESLFRNHEMSWLIMDITENGRGSIGIYSREKGCIGLDVPEEVINGLSYKPVRITAGERSFYCEKLVQQNRVVIFGGGHVAQALVPVLTSVDFTCDVVEDRADFVTRELFPDASDLILVENNENVLDSVNIKEGDYVCIMTRGHKDDMIIESQVLSTQAGYIGVIGSRKKAAGVNARLKEMGWKDDDLARITTPIGLEIKAETPAEIAVSIAAQLIAFRAESESI